MKISLYHTFVSTKANRQLKEACERRGVDIEIFAINSQQDLKDHLKNSGDIIFLRNKKVAALDNSSLLPLLENKVVINKGLFIYPDIQSKEFQSKQVHQTLSSEIEIIPTIRCSSKEELLDKMAKDNISFPLIQKPDRGMRGEYVYLLNSADDIKAETVFAYVLFQPYIKNDGDYRILVLGGKALGVIKRIAVEGKIVNNLSQGGEAKLETDPEIVSYLSDISVKLTQLFELDFAGVDIMYSKQDNQPYFLEINSIPSWVGFTDAVELDVSEILLDYCEKQFNEVH